ncbi:MAG: phosphonopyruvate decarboxylase [Candidatus Lokiarchaeia archaeon]
MISCEELISYFKETGINFFTGVSDSCFAPLVNYLLAHEKDYKHVIATNEGEALAISTGYHISTGNVPVVYSQNDGFLNMMNPLTSLVDSYVYEIPALLLISWRGSPKLEDAIQHKRIGEITTNLLDLLDIPYHIYDGDNNKLRIAIKKGVLLARNENKSYALLFFKGDIEPYPHPHKIDAEMSREEAIKLIVESVDGDAVFVSTTGKTSRELFEYREKKDDDHKKDFLNIGAMGYANAIALGISLNKINKRVIVLDGDGAVLMHMGNLATIGHYKPGNLFHIILNNFSHDSTGGQPTLANSVNFCEVARAVGYTYAVEVKTKAQLIEEMEHLNKINGPALIVVYVKKGARSNLGRPNLPLIELKRRFMDFMGE